MPQAAGRARFDAGPDPGGLSSGESRVGDDRRRRSRSPGPREKQRCSVAAVGHAGSFRSLVERIGIRILDEVAYADHHTYTRQDIERLRTRAVELQAELVVTTEKDACKMASLLHSTDAWWAVRLTTQVIEGEDRLRRLVSGWKIG